MSSLSAQHEEFVQRYGERGRQALVAVAGKSRDVPRSEVEGGQLRLFPERPVMTGPLVCQLCEFDFVTEEDFSRHKQQGRAGEAVSRREAACVVCAQKDYLEHRRKLSFSGAVPTGQTLDRRRLW